jgi:NAD(P)-dependent dehydrogenase (short-subunit alcohol dehydrogenase family)
MGPYFSCDVDAWEDSLRVNATGQLRALHALYPCRRPGLAHVALLAGGGTNGPFPNYSAYCASKILLIKMCELLDAENEDLNVFILGPGWVRTKIHQQTLANPAGAGGNYQRTLAFLRSSDPGTSHDDIYRALVWCIEQGKAVAGGRNLSVVHDPWRRQGGGLADWLRGDPHRFRLRRHGNDAWPRS